MLIGNRQSDDRLYRGIRYYNTLPLTSEDLHEESDLVSKKTALITNNIIGEGPLNEPACILQESGISLLTPSAVLINGDVSLIQADNEIVYTRDIVSAGYTEGVLCVVGWYQHLTSNSSIRAYGGVRNTVLENDLMNADLQVQLSTRYQFRWDTTLVDYNTFISGESFTISLVNRDETGAEISGVTEVQIPASDNIIRTAETPSEMTYALSPLYVVPILRYGHSNGAIMYARAYRSVKPIASIDVIKSSTIPVGEFREGTYWYNEDTGVFQVYVSGAFRSTQNTVVLRRFTDTVQLDNDITTPSDIDITFDIPQYVYGDILQVIYEGVTLVEGQNYVVSTDSSSITLSSFTSKAGDKVTITVTKLVEI